MRDQLILELKLTVVTVAAEAAVVLVAAVVAATLADTVVAGRVVAVEHRTLQSLFPTQTVVVVVAVAVGTAAVVAEQQDHFGSDVVAASVSDTVVPAELAVPSAAVAGKAPFAVAAAAAGTSAVEGLRWTPERKPVPKEPLLQRQLAVGRRSG